MRPLPKRQRRSIQPDRRALQGIRIELTNASEGGSYVAGLKLMLLMVAMTFAPAIVLSMTSFTRIIVVLALLRQAVGVVQLPLTRARRTRHLLDPLRWRP